MGFTGPQKVSRPAPIVPAGSLENHILSEAVPPHSFSSSLHHFRVILTKSFASGGLGFPNMPDLNTFDKVDGNASPAERSYPAQPSPRVGTDPGEQRQRRRMMSALCLLFLALSFALWHDRDFWPAATPAAESVPPVGSAPAQAAWSPPALTPKRARAKRKLALEIPNSGAAEAVPEVGFTARTVLPPMEVEVIAGDIHTTIRPGSDSVDVDLQPEAPPVSEAHLTDALALGDEETAADLTDNAVERAPVPDPAYDLVALPVQPDYPLLARQMKVQGSVVLQALISKTGVVQILRVVSGPQILASAARDAVRQWRFKPHYQGSEPVETQAQITVNFTISTN